MLPEKIYIDSGLLALLVVGATDKNLIAKHRRLREFDEGDYERLVSLINHVDQILVTPNTLTEASNLLAQHGEPERDAFSRFLEFSSMSMKKSVTSKNASRNSEFTRLGLTDAALHFELEPSDHRRPRPISHSY